MSLPKILKPKKNYHLIRCGRNFDGGYLLTKNSILKTKTLISFGILDDISFERDFLKIKPVKNYCYDKTLVNNYWKKRIFNDFAAGIYNLNFRFIKNTLSRALEVKNFFKNKNSFLYVETIKKKSITEIINSKKIKDSIFFKIDIEGSEYRLLDELIHYQKKITGLIIEFHDVDLHIKKIKDFIKKFKLNLTHIHPNNFAGTDSNLDPLVVEMTFEKKPNRNFKKIVTFPNQLDYPNNPEIEDIPLSFKNK